MEAWKKLLRHHNANTVNNKLSHVMSLFTQSQRETETTTEYKVRLQAIMSQIEDLGVQLSDIYTSVFIIGLQSQFSSLITAKLASMDPSTPLSIEDIDNLCCEHIRLQAATKDHATVFVAKTSSTQAPIAPIEEDSKIA